MAGQDSQASRIIGAGIKVYRSFGARWLSGSYAECFLTALPQQNNYDNLRIVNLYEDLDQRL